MAERFVRVDLSDEARDFRPIAVEPGVPLLDRSGANSRILFKWLGGLVAEPEWEGESVNFFVRDDYGGRLEEAVCQPAGDEDLKGPLRGDVESLKERIAQAKPETTTERGVHKIVSLSLANLTEDENRADRDNYFFKYRDVLGRWRLVWCWGYQRVDVEPATTVVCTDPGCGLLFVRRPGQTPRCPSCEAALLLGRKKRAFPKRAVLAGLLLLLLGCLLAVWALSRGQLVVTPEDWTGRVGSHVEFRVERQGFFGRTDVSRRAEVVAADPRVVRLDPQGLGATAQRPGKTVIHFSLGNRSTSATVTVSPAERPSEIAIEPPRLDAPAEVVILSDQGPAVQFPVGARFDDFRIEARYADGFTRMVTKKATMTTDAGFSDAPVSFSEGKMIGVRGGSTVVHAEFDGVATERGKGLQVAVTEKVDLDQIRLKPSPVSILPGETIGMDAEGFKSDKSIGVITGLGGLAWASDNEQIVGTSGPSVTGQKLGQALVTARLGSVTSEPAGVAVVDSIDAELVVDRDVIQMRVGESRLLGTDLAVLRGDTDLSRHCDVTSALPNVVRYAPETHSLVGVSPGVSAVTFAWGDKLATATVQVLPGVPFQGMEGDVVVEPAAAVLSPGQALDVRVFLLTKDGLRIDRTDSAVLRSSSPGADRRLVVAIRGTRACAVATGSSEIIATLPEAGQPGKAIVTVDAEPIVELNVLPSPLALSVGDLARLEILGASSSGTHELFPQPDLEVVAQGTNPEAIRIVGSERVDAVAPGNAEVAVRWQNRLSRNVPVSVTSDSWTDLTIEPHAATIHPGQGLVYQVTGLRGGRRRVLGPEDGVELFSGRRDVAEATGGTLVVGTGPGRTEVVAQVGSGRAEALLDVVPGSGPATGSVVVGGGPGYGYIGSDSVVRDGRRYVYRDGVGYVLVDDGGVVVDGGGARVIDAGPTAEVGGLRFVPDVVRLGADSPGARVRVYEVLADGTLGRDVTSDPSLEFNTPGNVATVDRTADGPIVRPVAPGETRIAARVGATLFAEPELLVQVGDVLPTGLARLDVSPSPLDLWSGEARGFTSVTVTPGPGQFPIDVSYSITVPPGQEIVSAEADGRIRGLSTGVGQVVIKVVEPGMPYDGLSSTAIVQVTSPDRLRIEPPEVSMRVGETTPPFAVVAEGADGRQHQVPATVESMDAGILRAEELAPGQFVATSLGGTQVRAVYRGRELFATVTVTGERFVDVETTLKEGPEDFAVAIEVLAAGSEGPLEYRTYVSGGAPPDVWVAAQRDGEYRRVVLESPRIPYGGRAARYSLIIEARSQESGTVQQYPFTFRLAPNIERIERTD